jgi:hypothetical protein
MAMAQAPAVMATRMMRVWAARRARAADGAR